MTIDNSSLVKEKASITDSLEKWKSGQLKSIAENKQQVIDMEDQVQREELAIVGTAPKRSAHF